MYRVGDWVKVYGQKVEIDDLRINEHTHEVELIYLDECIAVPSPLYTRDWCYPNEVQEYYPNEERKEILH